MTDLDAVIDAVAMSHGVARDDLVEFSRHPRHAYPRRLAAYVAHTAFGYEADELAAAFCRSQTWAYDALIAIAKERDRNLAVDRDVMAARDRARAILEHRAGDHQRDKKLTPLDKRQAAEARRLRERGWSVKGLAKRYGVPESVIAPLVGASWGMGV